MKYHKDFSIGIVSCGRPEQLAVLLDSLKHIQWDRPTEICYVENWVKNSPACVTVFDEYAKNHPNFSYKRCVLNVNVGFWAAWNILENLMEGDYRIMMQDDTLFYPDTNTKCSEFIALMKSKGWLYLNLRQSDFNQNTYYGFYTEQPHVEHRELRIKCGDYECFPRHFPGLVYQGIYVEGKYKQKILSTRIPEGNFPKALAGHQNANKSIIQSLAHDSKVHPTLTPDQAEQLWREASVDEHGIARFP